MLTTTLFLDFGGGIGTNNVLSSTAGAIRDIDGIGIYGYGTGADLTSVTTNPLQTTSSVDFRPLSYDFDLNGSINNSDITSLANAVLPLVQRALEPFDINVAIAAANTTGAIVASLAANDTAINGTNDAYVMVTDIRSNFFGGGSVGDNVSGGGDENADGTSLFGLAAADDLNGERFFHTGNSQDELALTFADVVLAVARTATGVSTGASSALNENLANRIAFTATHEALHTFGLIHTLGTGAQDILSSGDVMRTAFTSTTENPITRVNPTRENPFTVTRATLQHQIAVNQPNNYLYIRNDPDIGLRDSDADGIFNLAYITGTGAFDKITLDRDASNPNIVHVTVAAHNNATFTSLIQQETYDINLTTDTEVEILVDSSLSTDLIDVDADIAASIRIRGNIGDDQVKLHGAGASALHSFTFDGEGGNDTFTIDYQNGDPLPQIGYDWTLAKPYFKITRSFGSASKG